MVGGAIRIATIKEGNGYQELDDKQITEIIKLNNEQNEKLKQFLSGG